MVIGKGVVVKLQTEPFSIIHKESGAGNVVFDSKTCDFVNGRQRQSHSVEYMNCVRKFIQCGGLSMKRKDLWKSYSIDYCFRAEGDDSQSVHFGPVPIIHAKTVCKRIDGSVEGIPHFKMEVGPEGAARITGITEEVTLIHKHLIGTKIFVHVVGSISLLFKADDLVQ